MTRVKTTDIDPTGGVEGQAPVIDSSGKAVWANVASSGGAGSYNGVSYLTTTTAIPAGVATTVTWSSQSYMGSGWAYSAGIFTVPPGATKVDIASWIRAASDVAQLEIRIDVAFDGVTYSTVSMADTETVGADAVSTSVLGIPVQGGVSKIRVRAFTDNARSLIEGGFQARVASTIQVDTGRGCLAPRATQITGVNYSAETAIPWDGEEYDTDNFHSTTVNPSRMTIPPGVTAVVLDTLVTLTDVSSTGEMFLFIKKNGGFLMGGPQAIAMADATNSVPRASMTSPMLKVVPGDYFEVFIRVAGDTSVNLIANESYFALRVVEAAAGASGWRPLTTGNLTTVPTTRYVWTGLDQFTEFEVFCNGIVCSGSCQRTIQVSTDNGATWHGVSGNYVSFDASGVVTNRTNYPFHNTDTAVARWGTISITRPLPATMQAMIESPIGRGFIGLTQSGFNALSIVPTSGFTMNGGFAQLMAR